MNAALIIEPLFAERIQQIVTALRDTERAHILFVLVENNTLRQEAIAVLGEQLSGQRYLREFNYTRTEQRSLHRFCRSIPRRTMQVCVCAYGLEVLAERDTETYQTALELLNNHREDIRNAQTALVLWISEQTYRDILAQAPDFAAWREDVITLPSDRNADIPRTPLGQLTLEQAEDYRRDVRRYDEMLARPQLAPHFCTEFRRRRNIALAALGRKPDTEETSPPCSLSDDSPRSLDLDTAYYLDFIVRRNEYMDPHGVMQTTRKAMLKLDIDEFVTANSGNRFVVTSRIAGYRIAPLGGAFAEFTLEDMEAEQISRFLNRWCAAYERFLTPEAAEDDIQDRARAEVDDIEHALKENVGVQRLATNPLLLTILCLIKRNGAHMPRRRVELYEIATQTLLHDWQLQRGIPGVQCVEEDEALRLLGPLALWLHEEKPTGMACKRDVQQHLAELLAKERPREPDGVEVQKAVADFLRRVREHTGLFVECAPGYFGFMHLTFEEYFVGRELLRRYKSTEKEIYKHRHLPRWEEPILLAIGYESKSRPEYASDLIRTAILAQGNEAKDLGFAPSRYEDMLRRDLLFAAHCLGDCAGADPRLIRDVVNRVVTLYLDAGGAGKYEPLRKRLLARIQYLGDSDSGREAMRLLLHALQDADAYVRASAAEAMRNLLARRSRILTPDSVLQVQQKLYQEMDADGNEAITGLTGFGSVSDVFWEALWVACTPVDASVWAASARGGD